MICIGLNFITESVLFRSLKTDHLRQQSIEKRTGNKKLKIVVASRRVMLYITGIKCKKDLEHQSEYKVGMNMQVTYKTTAKGKVTGATGTLLGHFVF